MSRSIRVCTLWILVSLILAGCGNKIERNIGKLEGSQENREQAMMELTLAKRDAIEPLIQALGDRSKSSRVRVDVANILFRLYLREDDVRIFEALMEALEDEDATVRGGVTVALGDMGRKEAIDPLMKRLEGEKEDEVIYQILSAIEILGDWDTSRGRLRMSGGEDMTEEQKGDIWGFNVCRGRIANASEYGQWVPTYGWARRPDRFGFLFFE